jgi:hypothetical protein
MNNIETEERIVSILDRWRVQTKTLLAHNDGKFIQGYDFLPSRLWLRWKEMTLRVE